MKTFGVDFITSTCIFLGLVCIRCNAFSATDSYGRTELCDVRGDAKIGEGYNIANKERCQQFCDLTPDCTFWTWYKVHCDKLPCMGDEFTKRQVCYALKSCNLVVQKCDGCTSGTKTGQRLGLKTERAREAAEAIIRSEKRNRLLSSREEL